MVNVPKARISAVLLRKYPTNVVIRPHSYGISEPDYCHIPNGDSENRLYLAGGSLIIKRDKDGESGLNDW